MTRFHLAAIALLAAIPCAAEDPGATATPPAAPRYRIIGNVAFRSALDFDGTADISLYAEGGRITTHYRAKSAVGGELGLQRNLGRHLGLLATLDLGGRSTQATATAAVPHPLYLQRERTFTGSVSDLSFTQTAQHLSLVAYGASRSAEYALFAGPSLYEIKADLIDNFTPQESYPYDTVSGTFTSNRVSQNVVGIHVGGRFDLFPGDHFGVGAQIRYAAAPSTLSAPHISAKVTAGGLDVGAGLRLRF